MEPIMTEFENQANAPIDWDERFVRAANKKSYKEMEEALANGANINVQNVRGISTLHAAVMSRNLDLVSWLVKKGADPSLVNNIGDGVLHEAAKNEDPDYLKEILSVRGVNVNIQNALGSTPLMEAISGKRVEAAKILLEAGADVNIKSSQGSSAILIASTRHEFGLVKKLLSHGANANDADSYGVTALISAASTSFRGGPEEHPASVKTMATLIAGGADVNLAARSKNTALAQAAQCMNKSGMVLLLDAGADPNVHSTAGVSGEMTPLMIAAYKHDAELIDKILSKGADVNFTNNKGMNAISVLMNGAIKNEEDQVAAKRCVELLLKAGANLSMSLKSTMGLAHYGVVTESKELLKMAKEQGVLDQVGEDDAALPAVFYAVLLRKEEMVDYLKELEADFSATMKKGRNLLHVIAKEPYPAKVVKAIEMMRKQKDDKRRSEADKLEIETKESALTFTKKLIDYGVDINGQDDKGNTPLHLALLSMAFGLVNQEYIDFLVKNGADITLRNEQEVSPFVQVIKIGNIDIAEKWAKILIESGRADEVKMAAYDAVWTAPEMESQVARMKAVFERLRPLGLDIEYSDDDGQFPLLIAAATNQEDYVKALLDLGAKVDQRNNEGETAAFHSIKENIPNVTKILFDHGSDPDAERNDGESLMTIAYRNHRQNAVQQILDARKSKAVGNEIQEESKDDMFKQKKNSM